MTDDDLRSLAGWVAWPPTPADVAARLELGPRPRRHGRLVVALAVVALAIAVAMAVPRARSSILRFFHVGGVTITRVSTLPPASPRGLGVDLGKRVTAAEAESSLGAPLAAPDPAHPPRLYDRSGVVSALLPEPEPTLLSESGFSGLMKKLAVGGTRIESIQIARGVEGLWLSGAQHVFFGPQLPPRLAGNTLLWERGSVTFRIEGRALTRARAVELARQILGTAGP
jgi:hypothetical protein